MENKMEHELNDDALDFVTGGATDDGIISGNGAVNPDLTSGLLQGWGVQFEETDYRRDNNG